MFRFTFILLIFIVISLVISGCGKNEDTGNSELQPGHGEITTSGEITYTPAVGWIQEKPRTSMRIAQFKLPGKGSSEDAELAVFVFPGSGGAVQANIDRWIGQFKQPDGSSSAEKAEIKKSATNGLPVTLVYVTGTHLKDAMGGPMSGKSEGIPGSAMIAAIVETSSDPWFFKAVGPQATIEHWRPAFESFVKTFKQK